MSLRMMEKARLRFWWMRGPLWLGVVLIAAGCSATNESNEGRDIGSGMQTPAGGAPGGGGSGGAGHVVVPVAGGGAPTAGEGSTGCTGLQCRQVECEGGGTTTLSGVVSTPNGEVPLYNVIVYVPNGPVPALNDGVRCDRCGAAVTAVTSAITDVEGRFQLTDVPVGDAIPVVMQVGKWRRQVQVRVGACQDNTLPADDARLPRDQTEGDIPQFAITTGGADALECFLRKMGISDSEFTGPDAGGRVHVYQGYGHNNNPNGSHLAGGSPRALELWSDRDALMRYDVVVLSCEGRANLDTKPVAARENVRAYLDAGGRVFASHWHHVWWKDGPGNLPDTATWEDVAGSHRSPYTINDTFPKGAAFADWLVHVGASSQRSSIDLTDVRRHVSEVDSFMSLPWIYKADPYSVKYFSFNTPAGDHPEQQCGRAVYTDIHVSGGDRSGGIFPDNCRTDGLSAQEKALMFLLFDLSACVQDETKPPVAPPFEGPR